MRMNTTFFIFSAIESTKGKMSVVVVVVVVVVGIRLSCQIMESAMDLVMLCSHQ